MARSAPTLAALLLIASLPLGAGCSSGNTASKLAQAPDFEPKGQTKCGVTKSQARPLIVEWPSADRGTLESVARRGLVAVHYSGCEMEVLTQCNVGGQYAYVPFTAKRDRLSVNDADELYANLPVGAASLEGKLKKSGQLNVSMTLVGRFEASIAAVKADALQGACDRATHVITGLSVGAFEFFAGADASVGGRVGVGQVGVGADSTSSREMLAKDGDEAACGKATAGDARPPEGCGAFLRVEVSPLPCFAGMRYVEGRGCVKDAAEMTASGEIEGASALSGGGLEVLQAMEKKIAGMPKGTPAWAKAVDELATKYERLASKAAFDRTSFTKDELEGSLKGMSADELERLKRAAQESARIEEAARAGAKKFRAMISE